MADPTLPQLTVDTTMPDVSGYTTVTVPGTYATLQAALNAVSLGTIISLTAGVEYESTASGGDFAFTLPNKTTGSGWIILATAGALASSWLPAVGTRIDGPANSPSMAKVVCVSGQGGIFLANANAHHYRFIGIEVRNKGNALLTGNLFTYIQFDSNVSGGNTDHMIVDRCYVHGPGTAQTVSTKFAVAFGGTYQAVVDSYVSEFMNSDGEAKCIAGWNGTGPYKVDNNYLSATGITMMLGGADPFIPSDLASDVTVTRNYFYKPLRWRDDTTFTTGADRCLIKNHFELKGALRVLVEGNIFENCWVDGQAGYSLAISPIAGGIDTPATAYTTVQDVTVRKNIVKNSAAGVILRAGGVAAYKPEGPSVRSGRWLFENMLYVGIGGVQSLQDAGRVYDIAQGPYDLHISHNTVVALGTGTNPSFHFLYGSSEFSDHHLQTVDRMVVQDNIFHAGDNAYMAFEISATGDPLATVAPDLVWTNNLAVGPWPTSGGYQPAYPTVYPQAVSNKYELTGDSGVGYTDLAGGTYSLTSASAYHNTGHDGTDLGVDWTALTAATTGTVTGIWGSTPPPPPPVTGTREYGFVRII